MSPISVPFWLFVLMAMAIVGRIVDDAWCAIGSTNFDDRSFEVNDEVSLVAYDENLARQLEQIFESDLRHANAVDLDRWKRRSILHKAIDLGAFLFNEQL